MPPRFMNAMAVVSSRDLEWKQGLRQEFLVPKEVNLDLNMHQKIQDCWKLSSIYSGSLFFSICIFVGARGLSKRFHGESHY